MSMSPDEYAQEEWLSQLYEEHKLQALDEFRSERLSSFFLGNPELARPALGSLAEARSIQGASTRAALVLASAAAEVGLKGVLLKPVVYGLVQSSSTAGLIADLVVQHQAVDRFQPLLFAILKDIAGIDLHSHRRPGSAQPLWSEITTNIKRRNAVVHRCESIQPEETNLAIAVAAEILEVLFPKLVTSVGLHLHDGYRLCSEYHLPPDLEALLKGK